ncbi:MAG: HAD hydrolase family protein [Eubacteriales bacterium]|nr:HAD hydrolase family protein [Eubacteriales bacterium]
METLYLTDLDGTLLNTSDAISQRSASILNELTQAGLLLSYATARSYSSASIVTRGVDFRQPLIVYNGAFLLHPVSKQRMVSNFFSMEEKERIRADLEARKIFPLVYAFVEGVEHVSWLAGRENEGMLRYLSLRVGDPRLRPVDTVDALFEGEAFYFTCIGTQEELTPVNAVWGQDACCNCILQQELYRPEYWCELMPRGASKAHAARQLKNLLACDRLVVFGDARNDIPLFEAADESYAVENAVPELKAMATGVIGGNDDDAVALWLKAAWEKTHIG